MNTSVIRTGVFGPKGICNTIIHITHLYQWKTSQTQDPISECPPHGMYSTSQCIFKYIITHLESLH